jgi:hypothetical protein
MLLQLMNVLCLINNLQLNKCFSLPHPRRVIDLRHENRNLKNSVY